MRFAVLLILLLPDLLSAQTQRRRDDPDQLEILAMDEAARVRERDAQMRLLTARELQGVRRIKLNDFLKNVGKFELASNSLCTTRVESEIKQTSRMLEDQSKRLASFLKEGIDLPRTKGGLPIGAVDHKDALLCAMLPALQSNLTQLAVLERQHTIDLALRTTVVMQLTKIQVLSQQIYKFRRR